MSQKDLDAIVAFNAGFDAAVRRLLGAEMKESYLLHPQYRKDRRDAFAKWRLAEVESVKTGTTRRRK